MFVHYKHQRAATGKIANVPGDGDACFVKSQAMFACKRVNNVFNRSVTVAKAPDPRAQPVELRKDDAAEADEPAAKRAKVVEA